MNEYNVRATLEFRGYSIDVDVDSEEAFSASEAKTNVVDDIRNNFIVIPISAHTDDVDDGESVSTFKVYVELKYLSDYVELFLDIDADNAEDAKLRAYETVLDNVVVFASSCKLAN